MTEANESKTAISTFELQSALVHAARTSGRPVLDAGRGQPNWVATTPREGYLELSAFALAEANEHGAGSGRGAAPPAAGIADRLAAHLTARSAEGSDGADFLADAIAYGVDELGFLPDPWVDELVRAVLGAGYPSPTRMLSHVEQVVERYLVGVVGADPAPAGTYRVFATEGGAAAMAYVFNTLRENRIIVPGDAIAMATPIFTPYLQIPMLEDFGFRVVELQASHNTDHRFEDHVLDRLADPSIKAFFVINPGNPDSRAISPERMKELHDLVLEQRPDLVIVADTAYAAFVEDFRGTLADIPRNVICIHSYSKTFGATGNRLGVIAVHEDNVLDDLLKAQSPADHVAAQARYRSITSDSDHLPFVDRLVADSRDVALHNIAGLATPDQVQMCLFSLAYLLPWGRTYLSAVHTELADRLEALLEPIAAHAPGGPDSLYYALVDVMAAIRHQHGDEVADRVAEEMEPSQLAMKLADEHGVVVLPGQLFDAETWDVRVSLASLTVDDLRVVGQKLAAVIDDLA
ncbi:MAG: bifunctional aspartate transaminase/aspartate 4-decarboxylase [Acidimicrobiales bacterium]